MLIDDALGCLLNAFDVGRTGKISYKQLCVGLDVLCESGGRDEPSPMGMIDQ